MPGLEHLTPRQVEILRLVARALSRVEICHRLGVSAPTLSTHLSLIRRRLGVPTQEALLKLALRVGLDEVAASAPTH